MPYQTTMNGTRESRTTIPPSPTREVFEGAAEILHDVTELAELQVELLASDIRATIRRSSVALAVLAVGICGILGVIPILLLALAEILTTSFDLSRFASLLIAGGVGTVASLIAAFFGVRGFKRSLSSLDNSKTELKKNVKWMKRSLRRSSSSH